MLCTGRRILGNCKKDLIIGYKSKALLVDKKKTSLEKTLDEYIRKLLGCNTVHDYSNIKDKRIEVLENIINTNEQFQCCMNARQCTDEYDNARIHFRKRINCLNKVVNSATQVTKVIEQMNILINDLKDNKYVYLKFALDRNNELIGFILDYKNIFNSNNIATLYGVTGSKDFNECSNQGRIYMFLEFYIDSEASNLKIVDFFVNRDKTRCYHGTLTLETLIEAVKAINRDIYIGNNNKFKRVGISEIYGSIKPHEAYINRRDLYRFYEKNGFIEEGKLLKRITNYEMKI